MIGSPQRKADFAAFDRSGDPIVVVEAKRLLGTDQEWARKFRHHLLDHNKLEGLRFFVIATPDAIYIWRSALPEDAPPSVLIDARAAFAPYYERTGVAAEKIHPMAFELMVSWWLEDLARGVPVELEILRTSGLPDALLGAQLARQDVA